MRIYIYIYVCVCVHVCLCVCNCWCNWGQMRYSYFENINMIMIYYIYIHIYIYTHIYIYIYTYTIVFHMFACSSSSMDWIVAQPITLTSHKNHGVNLFNCLFASMLSYRISLLENVKARYTNPCRCNLPVTSRISSQRRCNMGSFSILCRNHISIMVIVKFAIIMMIITVTS